MLEHSTSYSVAIGYLDADDVTMTPYINLGVTEGVETYFVPEFDDGVSPPVNVDNFPLGSQVESTVYVC